MGTPKETRQSKVLASLIPAKSLNNTQTLRVVWFITFNFLILLSSDLIINTPICISPELSGYVIDLQNFDSIIKKALYEGLISIEETDILGIDNQIFNL